MKRRMCVALMAAGLLAAATAVPGADLPVKSGLKLWLKADAGVQVNASGYVTSWLDQSGNGYAVSQAAAARYPTNVANVVNGLPVVRFSSTPSGSEDYLERTTDALGFTGNPAMTVVSVLREQGGSGIDRYLQVGAQLTAGQSIAFCSDTAVRYNNGSETFDNDAQVTAFSIGMWTKAAGGNYAEPRFIKNGVEATPTGNNNPTYTINLLNERTRVGAGLSATGALSDAFDGDVAELIVYNRVLSSNELNQVGWYLEQKYRLPYGSFMNPADFAHHMTLRFPGYARGETLTNFPALVVLGEHLDGFRYADFASRGANDLRFTDSTGQRLLYHEVDEWRGPQPLAAWNFDDSLADVSVAGAGRNGTAVGGGAVYSADTPSGSGKSLVFDNVNDYVAISNFTGVVGKAPRSLACWVKNVANNDSIMSWGTDTTGVKWVLRVQTSGAAPAVAGALRVEVNNGYTVGTTPLTDGRWHHVAAVLPEHKTNVVDVLLYVDGKLETVSTSLSRVLATGTREVRLGIDTGTTLWLGGLMDDAAIWDTPLTAADIAYLHGNGTPPDIGGGSRRSAVWVRLPELKRNTEIRAHWGNASLAAAPPMYATNGLTWSESFEGVWHMNANNPRESGPGQRHAVAAGIPATLGGAVGGALAADGNDWATATGYKGVTGTGNRTVSAWVKKPAGSAADADIITWGANSAGQKWAFRTQDDNLTSVPGGNLRVEVNGGVRTGNSDLRDGQWHHAAMVLANDGSPNANEVQFYVDGVNDGSDYALAQAVNTAASQDVMLGGETWSTRGWIGLLDDLRLSSVVRSAAWLWAEYMTVAANDAFIQYGTLAPADFPHKLKIAFAYTAGEALTNFPALVKFQENTNFRYADFASTNGWDLRFADATGTNALVYEVEEWNTQGVSTVWVRLPQLTNACTIWAYWGSSAHGQAAYTQSGATWLDRYRAVYHLHETSGTHRDATRLGRDLAVSGTYEQNARGTIAGADYGGGGANTSRLWPVNPAESFFHNPCTRRVVSAWVTVDSSTGPNILYEEGGTSGGLALAYRSTSRKIVLSLTSNQPGETELGSVSLFGAAYARPIHVVGVYDTALANNVALYINGVLEAQGNRSGSVAYHTDNPAIGGSDGGSPLDYNAGESETRWHGSVDEVRLSDRPISANWIRAEYDNVAHYDTFVIQSAALRADPATTVAAKTARANGELVWAVGGAAEVSLFWGRADGGASAGGWDATNALGSTPVGAVAEDLSGLTPDATYIYRLYATNAAGHIWSDPIVFHTLPDAPAIPDLALWVSAGAITGVTNGGVVSTWRDLSGHARDLYRFDGLPVLVTNAFNGRAVVRFDGSSTNAFHFARLANIRTVVMVLKESATATGARFLLGDDTTYAFHRGGAPDRFLWSATYTDPDILNGHTYINGAEVDGLATAMPTSLSIVAVRAAGDVQANTLVSDRYMVDRTWQGDIAEVLLFTRELNLGELNEIGRYLTERYGLTTAYDAPFDPSGFAHRLRLTFSGYTGATTLTNFPALVRLDTGIPGFAYNGFVSPTGADLRFADATGARALSFEIEQWDTNNSSYVWVRVPELTAATAIWAYWGSASAAASTPYDYGAGAWEAGFKGVWHLDQTNGVADLTDATDWRRHAVTNSGTLNARAKIAFGQDFDLAQYIRLPANTHVFSGAFSVSQWIRHDDLSGRQCYFSKDQDTDNFAFVLHKGTSNDLYLRVKNGGTQSNAGPHPTLLTAGAWVHIGATVSAGNEARLYLNGVAAGPWTLANRNDKGELRLGRSPDAYWGDFLGLADEARLSATTRSADWMRAEYQAMADPHAFAQYDRMVSADGATNVTSTTAELLGAVHWTGGLTTTVTAYYGTSDGGAAAGAWQATNAVGASAGDFMHPVSGLAGATTHYFRFCASNSAEQVWSDVQTFRTLVGGVGGVALWLDASEIAGQTHGQAVSRWNDLSGRGRHALQPVPEEQPTYATNALGSRPAVRFLTGATLELLAPAPAQGATVFIVHRQSAFQSAATAVLGGNLQTTQADQQWALTDAAGTIGIYPPIASTAFSINVLQLVSGYYRMWVNGVREDPSTATAAISPFDRVGNGFVGDVAEVIVFNRTLTPAEQNTIGLHLGQKYGVATAYEPPAVDPARFNYRTAITYGYNKGGTLTNFPALVQLSAARVPGFDPAQFDSAAGHDLRFTDESGTNALNFEIEKSVRDVPVVYYDFNGTVADSSAAGHGYDGAPQGDAGFTNDTPAGSGAALNLGGADGYVTVPAWKGVGGQRARTISAWIKLPPASPTNAAIVAWGENVAGQKWGFRVQDSNGTKGAIRIEENGNYEVGTTPVNDNAWHHVAVVLHDGGNGGVDPVLFVDGQMEGVSSSQASETINTDVNDGIVVTIGNDHNSNRFKGQIDELGIWEACLTPGQIAGLYNAGAPRSAAGGLTNGEVIAWVQVPAFTNNCRIWAYWGSTTAGNTPPFRGGNSSAWDGRFEGVYHMSSRDPQDATTLARNQSNSGELTYTDGSVHVCQSFPGSARTALQTAIDRQYAAFSVSVWVKAAVPVLSQWRSAFNCGSNANDFQLDSDGAGHYQYAGDGGSAFFGPNSTNWVNLVATADGATTRLYYDGRYVTSLALHNNDFDRFDIGSNRGRDQLFQGLIDEVRVMNVAAASNWVWASYMMIASNATFGPAGGLEGPAPVPRNLAPTLVTDTSAVFNGHLSVTGDVPTHVWLLWGANDGANAWGAWEHTNDLGGGRSSGPLAATNTPLARLTTHHYAFFASNNFGTAWAQPSTEFTTLDVYFTVTPSNALYGTIAPAIPENVNQGGNSAVYTFHPNAGFHLTNVLVDGVLIGVTNSYQFLNVQGPHGIRPLFGIDLYTVTVTQAAGGTIAPDPAAPVAYTNDSELFTIAADPGYYIVDVKTDGVSRGPVSSWRFPRVTGNRTLTARFAAYPDGAFPAASLAFWIAADRIEASHGAYVSRWDDLSGHTGALHQVALAAQPVYRTNTIHGLPAVRFEPTHTLTNAGLHAAWPMHDVTVFVVHQVHSLSQDNRVYSMRPEVNTNRFLAHLPFSGNAYFDCGDFNNGGRISAAFDGGTVANVWAMRTQAGAGQQLWRNGALKASDTTTRPMTPAGRYLEVGNSSLDGDLAELLIFGTALDFADLQRVGYYLQQKYGAGGAYINPQHVDVGVALSTDARLPRPGLDTFHYSVSVTNNGPTNASGVSVSVPLPAGVSYVSDDSGGAYDDGTGVWNVGGVGYQAAKTLSITASLDYGTGERTIACTATVATVSEPDWNVGNSSAAASFTAYHESLRPAQFLRRMKIAFPGYAQAETLTNFPALVKLSESLPGFAYEDFASPGAAGDLRFAAADGQTALAYEIENWATGGTSHVWVKVPELAAGTFIWACWGNPGDSAAPAYTTNGTAWEAGFLRVLHLQGGAAADSTARAGDGSVAGCVAAAGPVDGALAFDGDDDGVSLGAMSELAAPGTVTISAWFKRRSDNAVPGAHSCHNVLFSQGAVPDNDNLEFGTSGGDIELYLDTGSGVEDATRTAPAGIGNDTWHHVALRYAAAATAETAVFVDGVLATNWTEWAGPWESSAGSPFGFGLSRVEHTRSGDFDGLMDELRIELAARSSNWIRACRQNQGAETYGAFVGVAEPLGPPLVANRPPTGIARTQATLRGELTSTGGVETAAWLYWGTADGLDVRTAWSHTNAFGARAEGLLSTNITALAPDTAYFYRFFTSNTYGTGWATPSTSFETAAANEYAITALAGAHGNVAPSGTEFVLGGAASSLFVFHPDPGYRVLDVTVDGGSIGAPASHRFTNVSTDHVLEVSFDLARYDVTVAQAPGGTLAPATHPPIPHGSTSQVFTVSANPGYYLHAVLVDGQPVGQVFAYQFTNVTNAHALTAEFRAVPAEMPVTGGLVLWLAAGTLNATNGQPLALWQDLSGLDHHVSQGTESFKPTFAANLVNGLEPAVKFSTVQYLRRLDALGLPGDPALTVMAVVRGPGSDGHRYLHLGALAQGDNRNIAFCTDAGVRYNGGNRLMNQRHTGAFSVGAWSRAAGAAYAAAQFWYNGQTGTERSKDITPPNLAGWADEETLIGVGRSGTGGWSDPLDGDLAELLVFNRELSADERRQLGRYLGVKYHIATGYGTGLLPAGVDDPLLWLSAEALYNITNNALVAAWPDLSGFGRDVVQATAGKQPAYVADAFNGLPALRFDGVDDYLQRSDALGLAANPALSVWAVIVGPNASEQRFLHVGDLDGADGRVLAFCTDAAVRYNNGSVDFVNDRVKGRFAVTLFTRNAGDSYGAAAFYKDGQRATRTGLTDGTLTGLQNEQTLVGGGNVRLTGGAPNRFFGGELAELIVYGRVLTPAERQSVGAYLTNKYRMHATLFLVR